MGSVEGSPPPPRPAADPDSEIITATTVTPGNTGDAADAEDLITDLLTEPAGPEPAGPEPAEVRSTVYGDSAYGTGEFHSRLGEAGIESRCKTQTPTAAGGLFSKDRFAIDLGAQTVGCPAGHTAPIRAARTGRHAGGGSAYFAQLCTQCPLRAQCTTAAAGRTITIGPYEQALTHARARQTDPAWITDYRSTRPKIERKLGHLMRRGHGGGRVRGTNRVDADFRLLAAAVNLARLAVLGLHRTTTGWAVTG